MEMLVFSDTHTHLKYAKSAIECHPNIQTILFLGDVAADAVSIKAMYPDKMIYSVRGNNDYFCEDPLCLVISAEGFSFFLTHGHRYSVKNGDFNALANQAIKQGCVAALFGHTHRQTVTMVNGVMLFNPGCAAQGEYGILRVNKEKIIFEEMQEFDV